MGGSISWQASYHPAKFGGHRHCGSGDITFLVVDKQDFTCFLEPHYCLSLKHIACPLLTHEISERRYGYLQCDVDKSDVGHRQQQKKLKNNRKNIETTFPSASRFAAEKSKQYKIMTTVNLFVLLAKAKITN